MAQGCVLLIGQLYHDGIRTVLDTYNLTAKRKFLMTQPANLRSIARILKSGVIEGQRVAAVVILLSEFTIMDTFGTPQDEIYTEIFGLLRNYPHALFVFENNMAGHFTSLSPDLAEEELAATTMQDEVDELTEEDLDWFPPFESRTYDSFWHKMARFCQRRGVPWEPQLLSNRGADFVRNLMSEGYNLIPYKTRKEVAILLQKFIRDTAEGTVLEVYVPRERVLAEEFDKFVALFHKYLTRVRGLDVILDRDQTSNSLLYRFRGNGLQPGDLAQEMDDFAEFLMSSSMNAGTILTVLKGANLSEAQTERLIHEFRRDWRRLKVDMQIALDRTFVELKAKYLEAVVDLEERNEYTPTSFSLDTGKPLDFLPWNTRSPVIINNFEVQMGGSSMRIGKVENKGGQNTFADQINRSVFGYNPTDKELLDVIEQYAADSEKPLLKNAVTALNDPNLSKQEKLPILKRVQTFLFKKVLPHVEEPVIKVLIGLLEKKIGGGD